MDGSYACLSVCRYYMSTLHIQLRVHMDPLDVHISDTCPVQHVLSFHHVTAALSALYDLHANALPSFLHSLSKDSNTNPKAMNCLCTLSIPLVLSLLGLLHEAAWAFILGIRYLSHCVAYKFTNAHNADYIIQGALMKFTITDIIA